MTREDWLNQAAEQLNEMISAMTRLKPSKSVLVSVGLPHRDRDGQVIGQCWEKKAGAGTHHIFISPRLPDAAAVLPTLLHELIHAADNCQSAHAGAFRQAWKDLGFIDKPTGSTPGPELIDRLAEIGKALGPFPHKEFKPGKSGPKPQVSRQLKVECPDCGCICRMSRKALTDVGAPTCACGTRMEEA